MKLGRIIQIREFRLGNAAVWSRAFRAGHVCGYTELSEVRQSNLEFLTVNIGKRKSSY